MLDTLLLDAGLLDPALLYEGELDGAVAAGVRPWPNAGLLSRKLARTNATATQAKGILSCRTRFLGLTFIDDKQGHEQPNRQRYVDSVAAL